MVTRHLYFRSRVQGCSQNTIHCLCKPKCVWLKHIFPLHIWIQNLHVHLTKIYFIMKIVHPCRTNKAFCILLMSDDGDDDNNNNSIYRCVKWSTIILTLLTVS
jgi:hypothetical protein